jgi:hypothetical protein
MRIKIIVAIAAILVLTVLASMFLSRFDTVVHEDVQAAQSRTELFADDRLEEKSPRFDPALIDSRPFGAADNRRAVNASAAVIGLDVPDFRRDRERYLAPLYPSYAKAAKACAAHGTVLPSVNLLDGKAKQFDDGLFAELDAAMTAHKMKGFLETSALLRAILDQLSPTSEAYAWVWGGLEIGDFFSRKDLKNRPAGAKDYIRQFEADKVESKPIGFYTWSRELKRTFRFLRYFQRRWDAREGVPDQIAAVLAANSELMKQYDRMLDFHAHLTNPPRGLSLKALADRANKGKSLKQILAQMKGGPEDRATVSFLPYSTSREAVLFEKLFPTGLPQDADLMMALVKAIRSGQVDLKPTERSGWYEYQVYALETFLLPERGEEHEKLLLKKRYKERMLQAFEALVTKRRETHVRQMEVPGVTSGVVPVAPPPALEPRLRIEPNPTFYLRTARAYAFLSAYLDSAIPGEVMKGLRGRTEDGERATPLRSELEWMKNFFYGLHLVSCEDLGMRPALLDGELAETTRCLRVATEWLARWKADPDLAADTRAAVPIYLDPLHNETLIWATLGVRGVKLRAWYATPPVWRPAGLSAEAEWTTAPVREKEFIILTDEFAEIRLRGLRVLTREELRKVCNRRKTKEAIVRALSK